MEAAQNLVKQRSMEALDKLRTYTNVDENARRGSTYNLGGGAGAKEPSHILTSHNVFIILKSQCFYFVWMKNI